MLSLKDVVAAWNLAHSLRLQDNDIWDTLATTYEKVDPLALLPVLNTLVEADLVQADAQRYRSAARRLARTRHLAAGTHQASAVDDLIAQLRQAHYRRPRLQQEFDRAGLPR